VRNRSFAALAATFVFAGNLALVAQAVAPQDNGITTKNVNGKWQGSWEVRLGTARPIIEFQQDGEEITGTFQEKGKSSPLTGTLRGKDIYFEVQFASARPYTIAFTGSVDGEKMSGTSQAKDVGPSGAYLGHGGEVQQPQHPWQAVRQSEQPSQVAQQKPNQTTTK
jgi:hypothetical protein